IDGKFFTDYKEQLEVATKIQGIMKNGGKTGELHVLGYDNVVNSAYMIAYAKLGAGDLTQSGSFLFNKGTNGFVKHNFLKSSGKEKEAFDYAYGLLKPAINNGALYLNVGGAYTSRLGVKDQIGLSIGSTAGYSHNYKKAVKQYSFDGHKITGKAEAVSAPKIHTGENYAGEFGHYQTPIAKTQQAAGKYGIVADQDKFKNVKDAILSGIAYSISSDSSQRGAQGVIQINSKYCLLPTKDKVTFKLLSTTHQLVKTDLQIKLHPYLAGGNTNKFTFSQGPSIIGVHANLKEDKGTREFMKWLTTKDTTSKISPLDTFAKDASYIAPTKGSFGKEVNRNTHGYNDATATAFNAFKEIVDGTGNIFTNPIDDTTSALRKAVGGAMNKSFVQVQSRDRALSISSVYGLIRADFDL
ncbi:MAG: P80 family lipoprotein, partial [Mycoplasmataceae bacterium]|nr:P80 family lipoprotein [Mycoplasmataceae bacterium]